MSASGGDLDNSQRIEGASDGTLIGNTGDKLHVLAYIDPDAETTYTYCVENLVNGVSRDMNVNGSVTPVSFTFTPSSGSYYLENISIFFADSGTTTRDKFGAITALTNGCEVRIRTLGTEYLLYTLKDNVDLFLFFTEQKMITPTSGFIETSDVFVGTIKFIRPIILQNSTSDFVSIKVRDNITTIDFFRGSVLARLAL